VTRLLIAECKQEISSFNPALSHKEDFRFSYGDDVLRGRRAGQSELAGALSVFDTRPDVQLVPAFSARAGSGGTLGAADWQWIAQEFLGAVRAAGTVDAAYISLHGAMGAQDEGDPEGYLLAETRKIVGERIPIVVSMDLHGILTERIVEHVNGLTVYHTYPHEDMFDTGVRAGRLLMRIMDGEVRPAIAMVKIPALVRGKELITATGLFGGLIRQCEAIEHVHRQPLY
jgi:microcystin degradation protein MlrC